MARGKDLKPRHRRCIPLYTRFWPKVEKTESGCWEWRAARNENGYGVTCVAKRPVLAHRASWEMYRGPIPEGMLVLHRCDNPPCVNPDHLYVGTKSDNGKDAFNRGQMTQLPRLWELNRNKTHCAQGHVRSDENTYVNPDTGARSCLICRRNRNKSRDRRKCA